jgi:pimeloyl-ACP methyl ester carboxylesterase
MSLVAADPQRIPAPLAAEQLTGLGKPGFLPALEALVADSAHLQQRLRTISCPTLILWGENDPVISVRDAEIFHRCIPGSRKLVWEQTGHVAMFERAEQFNELLAGFLSE